MLFVVAVILWLCVLHVVVHLKLYIDRLVFFFNWIGGGRDAVTHASHHTRKFPYGRRYITFLVLFTYDFNRLISFAAIYSFVLLPPQAGS